jgi:hypothetical protein
MARANNASCHVSQVGFNEVMTAINMKTKSPQPNPPGIDPNRAYPLSQFMELSGLGVRAMRSARRSGLRVLYTGRAAFVIGDDFIKWIRGAAATERSTAAGVHPSVERGEP